MNHYTRALAELKAKTAHKLSEVGDQWQTPPALFWGINAVFGPFIIDLFTDGENSKCPRFYTADNNALLQDWTADLAGGKAFANPPYSRSSYDDDKQAITGMRSIIAKVMAERDKGAKVVLLLKSATSEVWWPEEADHIAFVRGRISFDLPEWFLPASDKDKASSAGFAVTICVFDKQWRGQPMQYIERTTLLAQGNAIIDMIEQRASELAQQYTSCTIEQRPEDTEPGELVSNEPAPAKAPELITLEFTRAELEDQIENGKLPFSGDALDLILQLEKMFGKKTKFTSKQVKAAIIAFDDPDMISKNEPATEPEQAEQAHPWPYEVKQIVDSALAFMSYQANEAFYERLCKSCNMMLLLDPTQKLRTSNHIKTLISDKKRDDKAGAAA